MFVVDRNRFITRLVAGKDVLDVGCVNHQVESRIITRWLHGEIAEVAHSVLGLDYEAAEVEKLKVLGFQVMTADATDFKLDRTFDAIVGGEIMEHLPNAGGFLKCARSHLRVGGKLILSTPNAICITYFLQNLLHGRELDNPDHVCLFSPTTLTTLLKKCGYRVDSITFYPEAALDSRENKFTYCIRQALQLAVAYCRPSLCHHFIAVASAA